MPTPDEIREAVTKLAAELNNPYLARVVEGDPNWTEVITTDNVTFIVTVEAAEIQEGGYGGRREDDIKPQLRVVATAPVKVFGKTFTIDVDVRPSPWTSGFYVDGSRYGRGYRNTVDNGTPGPATDKKLDDLVDRTVRVFSARHPGWGAESTALGWESLARREDHEIERAQRAIAEAEAKRAGLLAKAGKARK